MNRNEYIDRSLIVAAANNLVGICERNGYVLTIETQPVGTPAMGSYKMVVDVRTARHLPKPSALDLDAMCDDAMKRIKAGILMDAAMAKVDVSKAFAKTRAEMSARHAMLATKSRLTPGSLESLCESFRAMSVAFAQMTVSPLDRYLRKGDSDSAS